MAILSDMTSNSGTLKKLSDNETALRTSEVKGSFPWPPAPGFSFVIYGKSLTDTDRVRQVATSTIESVERTSTGYRFKTMNSEYELEVHGEGTP